MAKKNYLKLAVVIVLTMAASSTVYAAASAVGTSIGGSSFSASNKVVCYYDSDGTATDAFDGTTYAIACGHKSGDKVIAAKAGDPVLYFTTTTADPSSADGAGSIAVGFDTTGWISM